MDKYTLSKATVEPWVTWTFFLPHKFKLQYLEKYFYLIKPYKPNILSISSLIYYSLLELLHSEIQGRS